MLFGATGRTDLLGPEHTDDLTHAQFHSVRRLAAELPGTADVLPTHGFGSFCSATPTSGDSSTVAEQQTTNPALTLAEQDYVDTLLAGLDAYPAYYAHMGVINSRGPEPVDLSLPEPVDADELRRRLEAGEWVVDLRERTAFAAGHLAGSLAFELSTNFVTYLGWLYTYGTPLTLIGDTEDQVADARRELVRIGIDALSGAAIGDITALSGGRPLRSYPVTDFAGLAEARKERDHSGDRCPTQRRTRQEQRHRLHPHPAARTRRPSRRGPRRRSLGVLRLWLPGLHRRLRPRPARPRRRTHQRRLRPRRGRRPDPVVNSRQKDTA